MSNLAMRPKQTVVLVLVLTVVAAAGLFQFRLSTNYRDFFGVNNPQLQDFETLQNTFSRDDNVLLVLAFDNEGTLREQDLQRIFYATEKAWETPFCSRVDSLTNYQHSVGTEDEINIFKLVSDSSEITSDRAVYVQSIAQQEPDLMGRLVSHDLRYFGVNIVCRVDRDSPQAIPEIMAFVRSLKQDIEQQFPGQRLYITGLIPLDSAFPEASIRDMQQLIAGMWLLLLVIMYALTRSWAISCGVYAVIVMSVLSTLGLAAWCRVAMTPASLTCIYVVMTLALADCIHIIVSMKRFYYEGCSYDEALHRALQYNLRPILITSTTTAIGFIGLLFSDSPPYRVYGLLSAVGVMVALGLALTFFPAYIRLIRGKGAESALSRPITQHQSWVSLLFRHRHIFAFATLVMCLGLVPGIRSISLNDDFVQYFDKQLPFRHDTDVVNQHLTGIYSIHVTLSAAQENGVNSPEFLTTLEAFTEFAKKIENVSHVQSMVNTYKRINKNIHADNKQFYTMPASQVAASQFLLLFENSLQDGQDLTNLLDISKRSTRVILTLDTITSDKILSLESQINHWLRVNSADGVTYSISGPTIMFSHFSRRNIESMIHGTVISISLITLFLMMTFRSIKLGALSLVANVFPILLAFGAWGLLFEVVGMGVSTIAAMTLGIVVDDTVHLLSKYQQIRTDLGLSPELAMCEAIHAVAPALIMTSLILLGGFFVVSFSSFRPNWVMGIMSCMTILFALIADLLFLPWLILFCDKTPSEEVIPCES